MSTDPGTDRRSFLKQCTSNYIEFQEGKKEKTNESTKSLQMLPKQFWNNIFIPKIPSHHVTNRLFTRSFIQRKIHMGRADHLQFLGSFSICPSIDATDGLNWKPRILTSQNHCREQGHETKKQRNLSPSKQERERERESDGAVSFCRQLCTKKNSPKPGQLQEIQGSNSKRYVNSSQNRH